MDFKNKPGFMSGDTQKYATGNKIYGGGRSNPTSGPVDKMGYRERDLKTSGRKNAMLRRMKANRRGKFMSSDSMTPSDPTQRRTS